MNTRAYILYIVSAVLLSSCGQNPPTAEEVLESLKKSDYFTASFFAPMEVGEQILTEDDHKNPQQYIATHYGGLIGAGLMTAKVVKQNAWRTVVSTQLTDQGLQYTDARRADADHAYVMVCNLSPTEIYRTDTIGAAGDTLVYHYRFIQTDITPFGEKLGYQQGKTLCAKAISVRTAGKWDTSLLNP